MGVEMGARSIAMAQRWTGFGVHLLAGAVVAGVALGFAANAHAAPATTAAAADSETAGRPVKLNTFNKRSTKQATVVKRQAVKKQTAKKTAVNSKYATKRGAKYSSIASRVQKASQKFNVAAAAAETSAPAKPPQPRTPSSVSASAGDSLKPLVADARAEMSAADLKAAGVSAPPVVADTSAPEASFQVAAADQLNDIDRAAAAAANETANGRPGQILKPVSPQRASIVSTDSTWDQTSWIGKLFVAFGGILTLASAARMFMA